MSDKMPNWAIRCLFRQEDKTWLNFVWNFISSDGVADQSQLSFESAFTNTFSSTCCVCVGQTWCVCALWVEDDVKRENQPANKWHILAVTPSRVRVCICVSQPVPRSTLAACAGNTIDFLLAPHCDTPANSPFIFPILPVRNFKNSHTNKESCCPAGEGVTQEEVERIWVSTMTCYYVFCTCVVLWLQGVTVINAGSSDEAKGSELKLYFLWQTYSPTKLFCV